jgi:hypothetical protein
MYITPDIAKRMSVSQLREELTQKGHPVCKMKKQELLKKFLEMIERGELEEGGVIKKYPEVFALSPTAVESVLEITKTERIRWTKEGKLKVAYYEQFRKWGKDLLFPMYDYSAAIKARTGGQVEAWRNSKDQEVKRQKSRTAKLAVKTRKRNQSLAKQFFEEEWKNLMAGWYTESPIEGSTLQLAYWVMWVNRYAKEMQVREKTARKKKAEYREKKELFYQMKNEAMEMLLKSPICTVYYYVPDFPDKITHLEYCPDHYRKWSEERKYDYTSKWEYFWENNKEIETCPDCFYEVEEDYYSLFYLTVETNGNRFSFHTPFPVGKNIFPNPNMLERVEHQEQDGLFRFGRELMDEEKIIFREKTIMNYFREALDKYTAIIEENNSKFQISSKMSINLL